VKKLLVCMFFVTMLVILGDSAQALTVLDGSYYDISSTRMVVNNTTITYGKALILESSNMSADKPTLLFFGGIGERSSARATAKLLEGVTTFDSWNVCAIAVARDKGKINEWKEVATSLREYISARVQEGKIDPKNIWIDVYSNGAAGGFYSTLELHGMLTFLPDGTTSELQIRELTFIEGSLTGIIKSPQIEQLLGMGIEVTMYVSKGSTYKLSAHGRELVKEFKNRENFTGILVDHGHGNGIVELVSKVYRNHEAEEWL